MNYPWILIKTAIIYFLLIIILRFLGKREVGQLSIFDLVILLIIADIASIGIDNDEFFLASLLSLVLLAVLQKLFSFLLLHVSTLRGISDGNPKVIVYEGRLKIKNMRKEMYTVDDLVSQMRLFHVDDISKIKMAILETNGNLSIFKYHEDEEFILPVVLSGKIVKDSLECLNFNKEKLEVILSDNNFKLKKILYASMSLNFLYVYNENNNKESIGPCKIRIK